MKSEYVSTMNNKDVEFKGVTFFFIGKCKETKQEMFSVPGGKILGRENAKKAAENLYKSNKGIQSPISKLADKTVTRLTAASRGDGCDMVLGV